LNNRDIEIARRNLLGLTPYILESMKASMDAVDTIDTNVIVNSIENVDIGSIESTQTSFAQLQTAHSLIENIIESVDAMDFMPRLIDEMATLNNILANSVERLIIASQINIPDFYSQISSIISDIDTSRYEDLKNLEPTLNQILIKYQWIVLPEMPMPFIFYLIDLSKTDNRQDINQLFFNYFSNNGFEELKKLVNRWESTGKFRSGRLKIIKDCLNAIVYAKNGKIPSTLIVPTLIAQIDGIQTEFLLKKNFALSRRQFIDPDTGEKMWHKDAWKKTYPPDDIFSSIANDIILDVLFASVYPGEPIKTPINFSRHKIMHGERLDYGTKYNVIRTFLILDFLHDLL